MTIDELEEALNDYDCSPRYYQRIIAMRLIAEGLNHNRVAEILNVSYRSINRWAHDCEDGGLKGLKPDFSGGKKSQLTPLKRVGFRHCLREKSKDGLTMMEAKGILENNFGINFSLGHVCKIVRDLGFNYGSPQPRFEEAEENCEETLKKTLIWQE